MSGALCPYRPCHQPGCTGAQPGRDQAAAGSARVSEQSDGPLAVQLLLGSGQMYSGTGTGTGCSGRS